MTEQSYVESLLCLQSVFIEPLRFQAQTTVPVLLPREIEVLFSAVKPVVDVHVSFSVRHMSPRKWQVYSFVYDGNGRGSAWGSGWVRVRAIMIVRRQV